MIQTPRIVKVISTLGLLPFSVGVLTTLKFPLLNPSFAPLLIKFSILYGALILSFLGGCLFAFECISQVKPNKSRLWIAILPTLWALIALQFESFSASILAIGFLLVYEFDRKSYAAGTVPSWWLSLRLPLTAAVILSLSIIGFYHGD